MNPTLNSPKYADPKSLAFQMYKKQQDRKQRKGYPYDPQLEQRYFRRNEGTTDYATIPDVTLADDFVIEFEASYTGFFRFLGMNNSINPDRIFVITDSVDATKLRVGLAGVDLYTDVGFISIGFINNIRIERAGSVLTIKNTSTGGEASGTFPTSSAVFNVLYQHNGTYTTGILANLKIYDNGTLVRDYPLNDNSSTIRDLANGQDGTIINGNADDWGLFDRQANGDWLGQELVVNGGFDSGVADWVASNAAISIIDGNMVVDDSAGAGGDSRAYQSILAPMISSYRLRVDNISTSSLSFIYIGDGSSFNNIQYTGVAIPVPSMYEVEFSTSSAGIQISLAVGGNGVSVFDNVSVKEVLKNA